MWHNELKYRVHRTIKYPTIVSVIVAVRYATVDLQHQYNVETPPLQAIRAAAAAAANVERNVRSIDMSNKWSHQCCMTLPTASRRIKLAGARAEDMSPTHVIKQPAGRPISILDRMMLLLLLLDDVLYFVHYILWTTTLLRRDMHTYTVRL